MSIKSLTGSFTDNCRNPTLEEQALARIHRIGQDKEVTTIRFYIRDSFEEVGLILFYINSIWKKS